MLVDRKLEELEVGQLGLRNLIADNTTVTNSIKHDTSDLIEAFRAIRWIGAAGKWLAGLAAAALTAWLAWKQLK
jgi:hypothetical protein